MDNKGRLIYQRITPLENNLENRNGRDFINNDRDFLTLV